MKTSSAQVRGPGHCAAMLAVALSACALAACAAPAFAAPAFAAPAFATESGQHLRDVLFGNRGAAETRKANAPTVARYVSETGGGFVFDLAAPQPLLKFDNSAEVWALSPHAAPRGDVIYKNELGDPVLRATKLGGMTLFTAEQPAGAAAALTGKASSIQPPAIISVNALFQRLVQASARASRAAQHRVGFETVQDATPETSVLVADAATVTAEAFERLARNGERALLDHIGRVLLAEGQKPGASLKNGALTVTYVPGRGVAGRPSSERIIKVVDR